MQFQEDDRIKTTVDKDYGNEAFPAGTQGTIVAVWEESKRYLVKLDGAQQNHIFYESELAPA